MSNILKYDFVYSFMTPKSQAISMRYVLDHSKGDKNSPYSQKNRWFYAYILFHNSYFCFTDDSNFYRKQYCFAFTYGYTEKRQS